MHILAHIYVSYIYMSYAILDNIFAHLGRISHNTVQSYQLVNYYFSCCQHDLFYNFLCVITQYR
jgi:hypothetical protein